MPSPHRDEHDGASRSRRFSPDDPRPSRNDPPQDDHEQRTEGRSGTSTPPAAPGNKGSRWRFITSIAIAPALIAAITVFITFKIAPFQEVAGEKAKQAEESRIIERLAPLQIHIEESWSDDADVIWLFDDPLSDADMAAFNRLPVASFAGIRNFADSRGGQRVGTYCDSSGCENSQTRFKLRLTGRRPQPVQITQLSARITQQSEPPKGTYISGPSGGLDSVQAGMVLLHSGDLRLRMLGHDGSVGRPVFDEKSAYVEYGKPIVFEIVAASTSLDFRWEVLLEILVDGEPQTMVVRKDGTPHGAPFRTPGRIHPPSDYQVYGQCPLISAVATCKATRNR